MSGTSCSISKGELSYFCKKWRIDIESEILDQEDLVTVNVNDDIDLQLFVENRGRKIVNCWIVVDWKKKKLLKWLQNLPLIRNRIGLARVCLDEFLHVVELQCLIFNYLSNNPRYQLKWQDMINCYQNNTRLLDLIHSSEEPMVPLASLI